MSDEEEALPTVAKPYKSVTDNNLHLTEIKCHKMSVGDELVRRKDVEALIRAIFRDSFKPCLNGEANELRNGVDREEVAEQLDYYAEKFEEELLDEVQD